MAVNYKITSNNAFEGLEAVGENLYDIARTTTFEIAQAIRDEALLYVPSDRGVLKQAMYVAFDTRVSSKDYLAYNVSWNKKKAPHGHLIENGHWQTHVAFINPVDGEWWSSTQKLKQPRWVPAKPFLSRAYSNLQSKLYSIGEQAAIRKFNSITGA